MDIDRITPTHRPNKAVTGHQTWSELLFVHWSFPPDVVRPLVPAELELDLHDGRAWVGIVPFLMRDIQPSWLPRWAAMDFLETNLRTYVHHRGVPGVYFFSLEASSWLAVQAARTMWGLPYWHARMKRERQGEVISYQTKRRGKESADLSVRYEVLEELGASAPGTFEHFLLERYYLYVMRGEHLYQGQVYHTPYPAHRVRVDHLEQTLLAAAGLPNPTCPPETAHYAPEVAVETFGPWRVHHPQE